MDDHIECTAHDKTTIYDLVLLIFPDRRKNMFYLGKMFTQYSGKWARAQHWLSKQNARKNDMTSYDHGRNFERQSLKNNISFESGPQN